MKFKVDIDKVTITESNKIESGEYNVTTCEFDFSDEYDELNKVAVFTREDGLSYKNILINNSCTIPIEVVNKEQKVIVGVYAYREENEQIVLRYSPTPVKITINKGSYVEDAENAEPPTPTEVEQILNELNNKQNVLTAGDNITIENNVISASGGSSGNNDYEDLENKPKINNVELNGNKTIADLGIFNGDYNNLINKPTIPIVPTNISSFTNDVGYLTEHQDVSEKENTSNKVSAITSINETQYPNVKCVYDLLQNASAVVATKETTSNKVTSISSSSTDTQYPSAKCVYDLIGNIETLLGGI